MMKRVRISRKTVVHCHSSVSEDSSELYHCICPKLFLLDFVNELTLVKKKYVIRVGFGKCGVHYVRAVVILRAMEKSYAL